MVGSTSQTLATRGRPAHFMVLLLVGAVLAEHRLSTFKRHFLAYYCKERMTGPENTVETALGLVNWSPTESWEEVLREKSCALISRTHPSATAWFASGGSLFAACP